MAKQERKADHGPDALYALRHSTAHVMAGAVLELFPQAKFGFGPPVADGFYYDFDLPRPLTPDDLVKIEERMAAMVKQDVGFEHRDLPVAEALRFFGERKQDYKVDQIEKLSAGERAGVAPTDDAVTHGGVSIYEHAGFVDLCRGPHVASTGRIGPFKLLSIAGAYWRGDENEAQLQRIYGTVWPTKSELDAYLERLKEIERRDHRRLGIDLELFSIDDELGSGLVLWLPNLSIVREELESWWRQVHHERAYTLVYTPHIANERIYQRSGHIDKFGDNMYGPVLGASRAAADGQLDYEHPWLVAVVETEDSRVEARLNLNGIGELTAIRTVGDREVRDPIGGFLPSAKLSPGAWYWLELSIKPNAVVITTRGGTAHPVPLWAAPILGISQVSGLNLPLPYWIKPMNCPGHIKVFQIRRRSYRELPMRIGELGTVYRHERGGTLHGMLRVRGFTQDDSHIFCTWAQAQQEIAAVYALVVEFLHVFGYRDPVVYLSTRPEKRLGSDADWDRAEDALRQALECNKVQYLMDEGGGTFYAPKIDIKVKDAIGREWQGPTIQIDMQLPERFDVTYVNEQGQRERAVMIHRVLFGSLERFVGGLIEHYAGNFPLWLAWQQVAIIPVRESARGYADEIAALLRAQGIRVALDPQPGDLRTKVREAQHGRPNYILVVGDKEAAVRQVSVRKRGAGQGQEERGVPLDDFIARVVAERDAKALPHDFDPGKPPEVPSLEAAGA